MRVAHPVSQVRAAEAELMARLPAGALMQRAATGLAVACATRLGRVYGSPVVLLVGTGDNGADALWAGSMLARRGAVVTAVLVGAPRAVPPRAGEPPADARPGEPRADAPAEPRIVALQAFRTAGGRVVNRLPAAGLVVDGLVGIGGRGALRPAAAALAEAVRGRDVVAVDLPSGVDADTGAVAGAAVRAALTVTFGTLKPGLLLAREHVGRIELVDLGLRLPDPVVEVLEDVDVAQLLPRPGAGADKYTRGVIGIAAGSQTYPGAAVLTAGAAVRAGAGMVRFVGAPHAAEQVRLRWPEVVVSEADGAEVVQAGRVQAWVVGPGLGIDRSAAATVEAVLAQDVPVLVDADALTVAAQHPDWLRNRTAPTLLTPHDREFARFGRQVTDDRVGSARGLAQEFGVTVLLKGDATVVVGPSGPARVNATGTPALATAGSGDVLSGAAGALLAQGLCPLDAGSLAAHLHGRAAALAAGGATAVAGGATAVAGRATISAGDLLVSWPQAVRAATALSAQPDPRGCQTEAVRQRR
ncbi:MAG: NAD(P)H-hydrate dehydratase [Mycobacteriales bacterium]